MPDLSLSRYGPWALVTGGSEGVGRSFALQLAEAGLSVLLVARRAEPLEATADECRSYGVEARTLVLDLARPDAAAELAAAAADLEVGLLVCNAGADTSGRSFLEAGLDEHHAVIDLNLTVPLGLVHHFAPLMRDRGRGGIVLLGSRASEVGSVRHTVYGGAKSFVRNFAEGLWLELRDSGVDVLCLVLGLTRTPAMDRVGMRLDVPGLEAADPDDVVREGLAHLSDGPVHVIGHQPRRPRAEVVLGVHEVMSQLTGPD